jgi:predicted amidophosphoribosyltransferase
MDVHIKEISGNWEQGYAMDKHIVRSTYTGDNEFGHATFDTERTAVGEALFQLKYRDKWEQVEPLAECLFEYAAPLFPDTDLIIPMAATNVRAVQPVTSIAVKLAEKMELHSFNNLLLKHPGGQSLKNLHTKEEKQAALAGAFYINDQINSDGPYNVLIIDDLYHTGASMEAAVAALRGYNKINKIYVAALTWR